MSPLLVLGLVMLALFIALIVQIARADARFADMAETCRRSNDVGRNNGAPGPATPASAAQGSGAFVARGWVRLGLALAVAGVVMAFTLGGAVQAGWITLRTANAAATVAGVVSGIAVIVRQWRDFTAARERRREVRFVTCGEAEAMLRDGWELAREEDRNLVIDKVYLQRFKGDGATMPPPRPCARCGHHHMHTGSLLCEACDGERKKGGAL